MNIKNKKDKVKNWITKLWKSYKAIQYITFGLFIIVLLSLAILIIFDVGSGIINQIAYNIEQNREWKYETTGLNDYYYVNERMNELRNEYDKYYKKTKEEKKQYKKLDEILNGNSKSDKETWIQVMKYIIINNLLLE